jgi:hypothetical protein
MGSPWSEAVVHVEALAAARAEGIWRRLGVREEAVDRRAALGGGGCTRCSSEWADNGEAPAIEEADVVGCFGSWQLVAPGLATGLTDARRRRLGMWQQLVASGMARWWWQQQAKREHVMEQSRSECTRKRKYLFPLSRAAAGDKGMGTGVHGHGGVNHGPDQTVGGGGRAAQWYGRAHGQRA